MVTLDFASIYSFATVSTEPEPSTFPAFDAPEFTFETETEEDPVTATVELTAIVNTIDVTTLGPVDYDKLIEMTIYEAGLSNVQGNDERSTSWEVYLVSDPGNQRPINANGTPERQLKILQ